MGWGGGGGMGWRWGGGEERANFLSKGVITSVPCNPPQHADNDKY